MRTHRAKTTPAHGPLLWRWILCTLGGEGHDPLHHPLGGFRCARCGQSGRDLEDFGFADEGYVSEPLRRRLAAEEGDSRAA